MRRRILEFDDVTCVVAANDIQAMRLMQVYRSAGRIVPDDVSVIGFDDIDLAHVVSPPLTTVHLGTRQLGFAAFRVLIERIKNPDAPIRNETLDVSMTLRDSLRRL